MGYSGNVISTRGTMLSISATVNSGVASAFGAWVQITAATPAALLTSIMQLTAVNGSASLATIYVQMGEGTPGLEVAREFWIFQLPGSAGNPFNIALPIVRAIPAGVRLAVRALSTDPTFLTNVFWNFNSAY